MTAETPTREVSAAQAGVAWRKGEPVFVGQYADGDADARARFDHLHRTAFPEPPVADIAPPTTPAEQAQVRLNELRADPDFIKRVEQGDPLAQAELDALHREATPAPLPFAFGEDVSVAETTEINTTAEKTIETLELDRELA